MSAPAASFVPSRLSRLLLWLAAAAVGFSAADTYVVVLALPDMMSGVGVPVDELQRAAPIISGFLLGYVAVLPLIGRVADVVGRVPVLLWALLVFAVGSVVTAAAYDLNSMIAGRFLQGLGGGGLVPATLALVADLYPPHRRGVPLGLVSAIQELGSVLGPVYGAAVLAFGDWRDIFWLNVAVGLVLTAALAVLRSHAHGPSVPQDPPAPSQKPASRRGRVLDALAVLVAVKALILVVLVMQQPASLVQDITYGAPFVPWVEDYRWLSPLGAASAIGVLLAVLLARPWRLRSALGSTDPWAAGLLTLALSGVVLSFATADPEVQLLASGAWYLLPASALAALLFWWRNHTTAHPLVPGDAVRPRHAWGSLVLSFVIGVALIAALTGVPIAARLTVYPDSQLQAAFVLVRLLVALPVGAFLGGLLLRRAGPGPLTATGLVLVSLGFWHMSTWDADSLTQWPATAALIAAGLGFGLTLAPINAALLDCTSAAVHGVASALVVVARMVGMLVGVSVLFALGLRAFAAEAAKLPAPQEFCEGLSACDAYDRALQAAALVQMETIFAGAAVVAVVGAVLALLIYRTQRVDQPTALILGAS